MKLPRFEQPRLLVVKAPELPISGPALLALMRAVLDKGVPFRFCARGWSMQPFIRNGDVITVAPLGTSLPGIGEVVAFFRPDDSRLIVHRVIARNSSSCTILGDNTQRHEAEQVPTSNVLGRVVRIEHRGQQVWLGLGLERYIIAWLSRQRLLSPLGSWLVSVKNRFC